MKRISKEAAVGANVEFSSTDGPFDGLDPNQLEHFVDIVSLDGLGGSPTAPGAGTYAVYYRDTVEGGFKEATGSPIDATKTGGSALADGVQVGASFTGNPLAVKIVPAGITTATHYRAEVRQN